MVILILRVVSLQLLPRALRWIYNRIQAFASQDWLLRLYEPLARRFPRLAGWLGRRLSVRHFAGLPLTLLVAGALYTVAMAMDLTFELLLEPVELAEVDSLVQAHVKPFRSDLLVAIFSWITDLGGNATMVAVSAAATAFALAGRRTIDVMPLWVTVLGTQVFTWAGKFSIARERPDFITEVVAHSPSFPSAHASSSLAIYGFIAYMLAREIRSPPRRYETVFWMTVLIALIGFSRIFLHVHHASDVLAGWLVGGFWLLIGISIAEWRRARQPL